MTDPSLLSWEREASRRLLTHTIRHDGARRSALLYVPRHIKGRLGLPLVIVLHGGASSPEAVAKASHMHEVAERVGFMVAYPYGTPRKSGMTWIPGGRAAARMTGDVRFLDALIASLRRDYEIDPSRIFLAGFSIGGSLVYEFACHHADLIAAAAVLGGTMTTSFLVPSQPVPLIHVHGTADQRVPFEGGRGASTAASKDWLPVRDCIDRWRQFNGCVAEPRIERLARAGATGYCYAGVADVELWLAEGAGHYWPGGRRRVHAGETVQKRPNAFSASEKIWEFFAAHPRPRLPLALPPDLAFRPAVGGET